VPLVEAVVAHPKLTWVYGRNEHDAATMAAAHAKLTGQLGVVIATSGPGATNLTTGLMEAVLDQCPVLAITGMKPTEVIGYSEFQDVNQSRLFAGAGIEWSKDVTSRHSAIPLLRDAVSTALSRRTCAHLAIPVDIQSAPSPLPLKHFCASHAELGLKCHAVEESELKRAAGILVGSPKERKPRTVIAVGLRAVENLDEGSMSDFILDLAEALDAPVITRLDAKGIVDETHPLSFGVIGVHGKPGLEKAADLISTSEQIVSIGVQDETLLLCNSAGLQIRKLIEIQPDAIAVGTRYTAEITLLCKMGQTVRKLTSAVESASGHVEKKRSILKVQQLQPPKHVRRRSAADMSSYAAYNSPDANKRRRLSTFSSASSIGDGSLLIDRLEAMGEEGFQKYTDTLWAAMHNGKVRFSMTISRGSSPEDLQ